MTNEKLEPGEPLVTVTLLINGIPVPPAAHWAHAELEQAVGRPLLPVDRVTVEVRNDPGYFSQVIPHAIIKRPPC